MSVLEALASLNSRIDYPESHMVLGGITLTTRNLPAASGAFREAVSMDPGLVSAWTMMVRILDATGDRRGARRDLGEALRANPTDFDLLRLQQQIGE